MSSLVSGEPLRVLLISPHAAQREEAGDALQGAGEHRFYWVSQPDLALTRAQGLAPHIVLVDDDLGGSPEDPPGLVRRLVQGLPESAVLLLAEPGSLAVAQAAVLAGARGFVLKPIKGEELVPILRQVLGRRAAGPRPVAQETRLGRVVVFCAPKGGTGRTTLAINTGVALGETTREQVVIVDADYAAPAIDVALNLKGQRDIRDLLPKLNQLDTDLISSVLATHSSGVRVLLAPPPDALDYPPTLPQVQQVTAWLKRMYPWVLVDLGLPLDEAAYAFLDGADRVVMSVLPDMVGMRNAKVMLAQFDKRNYPAGKVWPLLNREGLPGGVKKPDVAAYLARDLMFAIPNDQELATETINRGVPMVVSHRRRPVSQAYRKLASLLSEDRKLATALAAAPAVPAAIVPTAARLAGASGGNGAETEVRYEEAKEAKPALPAARAATAAALPRPPATRPSRSMRRPLIIGVAVLLLLLVLMVIGLAILRASDNPTLPGPVPPTAGQAIRLADTPTASPTPLDQPTHEAAATRVAEVLARVLGPAPGTGTSAPEAPPGVPGTVTSVGAVPEEQTPMPAASARPVLSPTRSTTPPATQTPTATPTPTQTATRTRTARPALTPTQAAPPPPTLPATAAPALTARPAGTPEVLRPSAPATAPPPTPSAMPPAPAASVPPTRTSSPAGASPPALLAPGQGQGVGAVVTFRWRATAALPSGSAYEVAWWNPGESPELGRAFGAPTTGASLTVDLAPLYNKGSFGSTEVFWTVLVVRRTPYARLTSPSGSEQRSFKFVLVTAGPG